MAQYIVTKWHLETITKVSQEWVRQRPAAFNRLYARGRDTLAAFGKLDTIAAHAFRDAVNMADDLMAVGTQRAFSISNTGYSVTIERVE
jgi:hypothetical protein